MEKIPIEEAKNISEKYQYAQVVILALSNNNRQDGWVTTFNKNKKRCRELGPLGQVLIRLFRSLYNFPHDVRKWEEHFDKQEQKDGAK